MSGIRQAPGGTMARWRMVAALLSLYGLVLQAFLAGLAPAPVAAVTGLLCQSHPAAAGQAPAGEPPGGRTPGGEEPFVHAHACCTVACQVPLAPPAPATAEAWPPRAALVLSWPIVAADPASDSPARPASARGPPAA